MSIRFPVSIGSRNKGALAISCHSTALRPFSGNILTHAAYDLRGNLSLNALIAMTQIGRDA
jgi:hypothetical protein